MRARWDTREGLRRGRAWKKSGGKGGKAVHVAFTIERSRRLMTYPKPIPVR
jgi:hypothetical protein